MKHGETSTYGIYRCVRTVHDSAYEANNNVKSAIIESKTKRITLTKTYPSLALFPFAVQWLISTRESKVIVQLQQHMSIPVREQAPDGLYICSCLFSHRYQLPCQHIFHIDQLNTEPILSQSKWEKYFEKFDAGGMEIYESLNEPFERLEVVGLVDQSCIQ